MPFSSRCHAAPHTALCTVEDQGPGLPAVTTASLFEPFQLGRDPEKGRTGVGLGLAMVQMTAQRHGGAVGGENRPGRRGPLHTLTLPLSAEDDLPEDADDPAQA